MDLKICIDARPVCSVVESQETTVRAVKTISERKSAPMTRGSPPGRARTINGQTRAGARQPGGASGLEETEMRAS